MTSPTATRRQQQHPSAPQRQRDPLREEWLNRVGISPPSTCDPSRQPLSVTAVQALMKVDGFSGLVPQTGDVVKTDIQKIAHFFYGFGDFIRQTKDVRVQIIQDIRSKNENVKRMMSMLGRDSDTSHCFNNFGLWSVNQGIVLLYNDQEGAVTIFQEGKVPLVLRIQSSKNCYQIAPSGVISYKICQGRQDNNWRAESVDTARYSRRTMTCTGIHRRVVKNKGGPSKLKLEEMVEGTSLEVSSIIGAHALRTKPEKILECLEEYGAGLVSRFGTDDIFRQQMTKGLCKKDENYYIPQFDHVAGKDVCKDLCLGPMTPAANEELMEVTKRIIEQNPKLRETFAAATVTPDNLSHAVSKSESEEDSGGSDVENMLDDDTSDQTDDESSENDTIDDDAKVPLHIETQQNGRHAMILVGGRKERVGNKNKYWFLIQNSWKRLSLFEASLEYLVHHLVTREGKNGTISFLDGNAENIDILPKVKAGVCLEAESGYEFDGEDSEGHASDEEGWYDSDSDIEE